MITQNQTFQYTFTVGKYEFKNVNKMKHERRKNNKKYDN